MAKDNKIKMSFGMAVITLLIIAAIMAIGIAILKLNTMVAFIITLFVVSIIAVMMGMDLETLQETILTGFRKFALIGMIMVSVGMVVGTWMISGVVPTIIFYGLKLFTPALFLSVGFLICCIVSFFTGSSYAALATMGVAFMGIGYGMEINPGLVAGMAVSGAVFGDKMSPFSDTTNMAPAAAGTDVFAHIKSMIYTVLPSFVIALVIYFILGLKYNNVDSASMESLQTLMDTLDSTFNITPVLFIVPIITIILVAKKVPAMVALMIGAIAGMIAGIITQPQFTFQQILTSLSNGFSAEFEDPSVAKLLNRGGVSAMTSTIIYAMLALELGELMSKLGVLNVILDKIQSKIMRPCNLIIATLISCLATVMLTTAQYMAILLPGEIFRPAYEKAKIAPYVLSRTLEDGGTIFSYLVPWSAAAIYASGVLGVQPLEYLPYAFLCLACPVMAVICAITGIGIFDTDGNHMKGKGLSIIKQTQE